MFERFNEKARRLIFFARFEASQLGSGYIEPEHLLLGLFREDKAICAEFIGTSNELESIRKQIEDATFRAEKRSTSVDLPMSEASRSVLDRAEKERVEMGTASLDTAHVLIALLEQESRAAEMLRERNVKVQSVREQFKKRVPEEPVSGGPLAKLDRFRRLLIGSRASYEESLELLSDNLHLMYIKSARHAFRTLLRSARREGEEAGIPRDQSCESDLRRYIVLLCGRILGGEDRELTEADRRWIGQVLAFEVPEEDFITAVSRLRSTTAGELDKLYPILITKQTGDSEFRIY